MPISRLTAWTIQNKNNDIQCAASSNAVNEKYAGLICLFKKNKFDRLMLNTEHIYSSQEEAESAMENLVAEIRKEKLDKESGDM